MVRCAFRDTDRSWQVSVSEGGTCTRGLRIYRPKRPTFAALASSPRVRLRSTTNTQGLPCYRLTILPSQNASVHVPGDQFITLDLFITLGVRREASSHASIHRV